MKRATVEDHKRYAKLLDEVDRALDAFLEAMNGPGSEGRLLAARVDEALKIYNLTKLLRVRMETEMYGSSKGDESDMRSVYRR